MKFCAVRVIKGKEIGRSKPLPFEEALSIARGVNRSNQDRTWNAEWKSCCYVEEALSVKHLPVIEIK